jgi:tripeptide aminopeptidase
MADPSLPRPAVRVAFVPDEEIGHGASLLDVKAFGAPWCYTVDGEPLGEYNYECFSASQADVHVTGTVVHPGSAKDIMVNALTVLREFDELLPADQRPEHTCGYEGYYHRLSVEGTPAEAHAGYIVRDFDSEAFAARERTLADVAAFLNARYEPKAHVEVSIREEYRNMAEQFGDCRFLIDNVVEANRMAGLDPEATAIRGGTDGAQLTFRGLPCPNIATGAYNAHSVREFVPVASLEKTVDVLENLVSLFSVPQTA